MNNFLFTLLIHKPVYPIGQTNFGVIEINWDAVPVNLKFEVRDASGIPVISVNTSLLELQARNIGSKDSIKDGTKAGEYQKHCSLEVTLPWIVRYRLAILFFCTLAGMLSSCFAAYIRLYFLLKMLTC